MYLFLGHVKGGKGRLLQLLGDGVAGWPQLLAALGAQEGEQPRFVRRRVQQIIMCIHTIGSFAVQEDSSQKHRDAFSSVSIDIHD